MAKSADAFRTISEVADWLGIQAHVLRFWESKFTQVKPIKRAGGRRYYRPADMQLLGGIKKLLHDDGLTIKGVQKILREEGMSHVAALSIPLDDAEVEKPDAAKPKAAAVPGPEKAPEPAGVVLPFETENNINKDAEPAENTSKTEDVLESAPDVEEAPPETDAEAPQAAQDNASDAPVAETAPDTEDKAVETSASDDTEAKDDDDATDKAATDSPAKLPSFLHRPLSADTDTPQTDNAPPDPEPATAVDDPAGEPETVDAKPAEPEPAAKPRIVDLPPFTPEADIDAAPSLLTHALKTRALSRDQAGKVKPLLAQLTVLRDQMAQKRRPTPGA